MSNQNTATSDARLTKYIIIAIVVAIAFFASYQLANAASGGDDLSGANASTQAVYTSASGDPAGEAGSAGGCSCCGDTGGETIEGAAEIGADGIQRIAVDASNGYNPNVIVLQANTPTEITFGQGFGCMAEVMSADLGFFEDLQSGPKTIALDGLAAGTYGFSCGMEMVFGQIVVQ